MKQDKIEFSLEIFEDWLNSFYNFEKNPEKNIFWLKTMEFLANEFGNPQNEYKIIHVAGSKGKGSVSAFCANILTECGYKTGLYTSPHISSFFERITMSGRFFSKESYLKAAEEMYEKKEVFASENLPESRRATWFELATLYAFLVFRQEKCEYVVLETGMGGRLDATNICRPVASIITPIELEHTEYLGKTIEKIAYEKAGIIKTGVEVFVSEQRPEAEKVLEKTANEKNARIFFAKDFIKKAEYFLEKGRSVFNIELQEKNKTIVKARLNAKMYGKIQAKNCALAGFVLYKMLGEFPVDEFIKGAEKTKLDARFEIQDYDGIKTVFDGAHTVNSMNYTLETYRELFPDSNTILFACAKDKDMEGMADCIVSSGFTDVFLTKPGTAKKSDMERLEKAFERSKNKSGNADKITIAIMENTKEAFAQAMDRAKSRNESLLVAGSFYLVAEIKNC